MSDRPDTSGSDARGGNEKSSPANAELWRSPLTLALVGGILTLGINILTNTYNSHNALRAEREKFQAELIKQFLEPTSVETRTANLRFLAESGLIPQFGEAIKGYLDRNPNAVPQTVAAAGAEPQASPFTVFGADTRMDEVTLDRLNAFRGAVFTIENGDGRESVVSCSGVLIAPDQIATASYCVPGALAAGDARLASVRITGSAVDENAKPAIASVTVFGESNPERSMAVLKLSAPYSGAVPLSVATSAPQAGDPVMLVYAPEPGKFFANFDDECRITEVAEKELAYRCDAAAGSGGAPVMSAASGSVIAIHTWTDDEARHGVRLDTLGLTPR